MSLLMTRLLLALTMALDLVPRGRARNERGDVPGWVLITVMTAGLVAGLIAFVGPELQSMLRRALDSVSKVSGG
ncbi:hypothetical protein [Kribbella deserti]|uniref:Uncharacterized protein n=1 Tax=Kribbella deserti TaxID=1926257 RepID=A0ABV6QPM3_9ACTN